MTFHSENVGQNATDGRLDGDGQTEPLHTTTVQGASHHSHDNECLSGSV